MTSFNDSTPSRRIAAAAIIVLGGLGVVGFGLGALGLVAPGAKPGDDIVYGLTFDRAWITGVALLALAATVIGALGLARAARGLGAGRRGAIVALALGSLGVIGGVLNLALADGGPGTGNGVIGGSVALLLGLIATILGAMTLIRSRHTIGSSV